MSRERLPDNRKTRFYKSVFRHKLQVIAGFIIASVVLIYSASGMKLKEDIMDLLPTQDPVVKNYKTLLTGFHRLDFMLIDIGPEDEERPASKEELMLAGDTLAARISASPLFKEIQYKMDVDEATSALDVVRKHRAALFTEDDRKALEEKVKIESIREMLGGWKKLLTESPAPFLSQSFYSDPLAMDAVFMNKLEAFRSPGGEVKIEEGRIFSRDMRHILILAEPVYPGSDNIHAKELIGFMDKSIRESELSSKVHISYMGSHRFGLDNSEMIKGDVKMTLTISAVSISILALLVFRRPILLTLLTLFPAFFGGVFASGMIMLVSPEMSAIAIGCGAMLMGIVVDFGIHFLYHVDQLSAEDTDQEEIIRILDRLFVPIVLTAATTLIAFLTMELSVLPGYRQLGLFAAFGIAGAFAFALVALPLLIPKTRPNKRGPVINLTNIYPPFFSWLMTHRKRLFVITAALSLTAGLGLYRLEFEGDIQKLNAVFPDTKRDWDVVVKSFGSTMDSTSVAVTGKDMDEALVLNEKLHSELLKMQGQGLVRENNSISPIFPSKARQEENRLRWKIFWSRERVERLLKDVEQVCNELRMQPQPIKNLLSGLPGPMPVLELEALNSGFLKNITKNQVSIDPDKAMLLTSLKLRNEDNDYEAVAGSIEKAVPGAITSNGRHFVQRIVRLIHMEMKRLGGVTLIFVAIAMAFYAKRVGTFVRLLLPLFLSLFWTFGMMGWLGIKINIMNSIIVIFIFGVVDDYCVFLHEAWEEATSGDVHHLSHTSGAITISAITTILGLGSLVFARHPALHTIGATALLGISFGLAAVLLTIPMRGSKAI